MDDCISGPISGFIGDRMLVEEISLPASPGKITVVFAPSGAGKTSLLRMIAGLWDGKVIGLKSKPNMRIGYIAQRDFLFPWLTLAKNIELPAALVHIPKDERDNRLRELASRFNIDGLMNRYPYEVSGGELQRALVVRGLVAGAKLLLLDEPMNSLDVASRLALRESLRNAVKDSNIALVLVTHEIADAISIADIICIFSGPPLRSEYSLSRISEDLFALADETKSAEETRVWVEVTLARLARFRKDR